MLPNRLACVLAILSASQDCPRGDTACVLTLYVPLTPEAQLDADAFGHVAEYLRAELVRSGKLAWSSPILRIDGNWAIRPENNRPDRRSGSEESPHWKLDVRTVRPGEYLTLLPPGSRDQVYRIVNVELC